MRFVDFDPKRLDDVLPPIPEPAPQVIVYTEKQWQNHWTREKWPGALGCAGLYTWEPAPSIYLRGGRYTHELDLTYAHEQAHHRWRFGMVRRQRSWWSRWVAGNPQLLPRLKNYGLERNAEEWFAECFGLYFSGRLLHPATARRIREVCGLPPGEARMRRVFAAERRVRIDAQCVLDL